MLEGVSTLPDDARIEDAMEKLLFLAKIEQGLEQANNRQTIPHDEVKTAFKRWID